MKKGPPSAAEEHKAGWGRRIGHHLKAKMVAGLLVVIPVGVTIFILRFLFNLADGVLAPYIHRAAVFLFGEQGRYIPGLGMFAGVLVIYLTGLVASNVLGRRLVDTWDRVLSRIPLVKSIYTSSKQLISVLSPGARESFRRAVYVEFPKEDTFSIAFITNAVPSASGKTYYTVFIPTSPNPTSGYVLILEEHKVYPTEYSVEEAMKVIMSGGIVVPREIVAQKLQ